jgi:Transposase, Mutator family
MHTMPRGKLRPTLDEVKALLAENRDFVRPVVQAVLQELLEAEMTEALGAEKGERTAARLGYRSGYYGRTLVARSANWSCGCCKIGKAASRPSCSRATSVPRGPGRGARRDVRAGRLDPQGQGDH